MTFLKKKLLRKQTLMLYSFLLSFVSLWPRRGKALLCQRQRCPIVIGSQRRFNLNKVYNTPIRETERTLSIKCSWHLTTRATATEAMRSCQTFARFGAHHSFSSVCVASRSGTLEAVTVGSDIEHFRNSMCGKSTGCAIREVWVCHFPPLFTVLVKSFYLPKSASSSIRQKE